LFFFTFNSIYIVYIYNNQNNESLLIAAPPMMMTANTNNENNVDNKDDIADEMNEGEVYKEKNQNGGKNLYKIETEFKKIE